MDRERGLKERDPIRSRTPNAPVGEKKEEGPIRLLENVNRSCAEESIPVRGGRGKPGEYFWEKRGEKRATSCSAVLSSSPAKWGTFTSKDPDRSCRGGGATSLRKKGGSSFRQNS